LILEFQRETNEAKMERLPVDDGKLDLSMSQLDEVPMKGIVSL